MPRYKSGTTYGSGKTYSSPESFHQGFIAYFDPVTPAVGESVEQGWVAFDITHANGTDFSLDTLTPMVMISAQRHEGYLAFMDSLIEQAAVQVTHTNGSDFVLLALYMDMNQRTRRQPSV